MSRFTAMFVPPIKVNESEEFLEDKQVSEINNKIILKEIFSGI